MMFAFFYMIVAIIFLLVEFQMLCHLIIESTLPNDKKKAWALGFVIAGGIAAIIYYFVEYNKKKS